ncbi:hypothetical protein E6C60_4104 [Paenibacillus algicola]|uniref:DUF4352 domain-containing protein n=1 Tax=Paenibacillus algicola TaxID=2565926 RepID=A0A4P8XVA4_9BACL|nr:DUF4352 domain-containing protein [Paenibacillus algicola]QCT04809.1 hypothetical protein E6C60_4104 [Paenibacillus algicola]
MMKKLILPMMASAVLLAGCSSGDTASLEKEVEDLKQEVAALRDILGVTPVVSAGGSGDQSEAKAPAGKGEYVAGQPFEFEGVTYTFTVGERQSQLSDKVPADDGKEFYIVNADIHNTSNEDYAYSQASFSVVTSSGEIEDNYFFIDTKDQHDELGHGDLAPNGKKSGWIAFHIQKGDQPSELRYEARTFAENSKFKVQLP